MESRSANAGNPVGDYYIDGNRELEEEKQVNNAIGENQLENPQYKLSQRNGKYSSERSQERIEREMPGVRKEIATGELITATETQKGR